MIHICIYNSYILPIFEAEEDLTEGLACFKSPSRRSQAMSLMLRWSSFPRWLSLKVTIGLKQSCMVSQKAQLSVKIVSTRNDCPLIPLVQGAPMEYCGVDGLDF